MNPDNVLMGDLSQTTGLPQTSKDTQQEAIAELQKKAKYSRSKEFSELKANMQQRIEFYQKYLPSGVPVATLSQEDAAKHWPVANLVIAELQQVIDMYEGADIELKAIVSDAK